LIPAYRSEAGATPKTGDPIAVGRRIGDPLACLLLAFVCVLGFAVSPEPPWFDQTAAAVAISVCPPWLATIGDILGGLPVAVAVAGGLSLISLARRDRRGALAAAAALVVEVPTEGMKLLVGRPRPPGSTEVEAFGSVASYPSGHVVRIVVIGALAVIVVASAASRRWRVGGFVVAGIVAGLVAFARVGAGAHWPTDVLAGIVLGCAWLLLVVERVAGRPGDDIRPAGADLAR
jgi:membrane-associated phospholipid phosphatase